MPRRAFNAGICQQVSEEEQVLNLDLRRFRGKLL